MAGRVAIFCASSSRIDPAYGQAARALVRGLHALGWTVVSGGGARGTMGDITEESHRCGGHHVGVLPRFMAGWESPHLSEVFWTDTMAQRKARMREGADAVIALPGGTGTLDELVETQVLKHLGQYQGKIYALNLNGFFDPYISLLDHYVATGMLVQESREHIVFASSVDELLAHFR